MRYPVLFFLFSLPVLLSAQDSLSLSKYINGITQTELQVLVGTLASDEFEGRDTGKKGQKLAAEYLRKHFIEMGLEGPSRSGDPYYQEFYLLRSGLQELTIIQGQDTLRSGQEFALYGNSVPYNLEADVVFLGYGLDVQAWNDYPDDLSVEGKIVAFFAGEPKDKNGKYLISGSFLPTITDRGKTKTRIALEKGAIGAIRIDPDQEKVQKEINMLKRFRSGMQMTLPNSQQIKKQDMGTVNLGIEDADCLLNLKPGTLKRSKTKIDKKNSNYKRFTASVKAELSTSEARVNTENVVGLLRGESLPDEFIIVTAHYDHLGVRNSDIYNGADDNATGTAAVVEIAEAFCELATDGHRPARSVLFMPVSGEERGLLGSRYYVQNPLFPITKTRAAVNMDMIGRSDQDHIQNPDYVYVYLSDSVGSVLDNVVNGAAKLIGEELGPEYRHKADRDFRLGGSDHASFEQIGVPVLYFYCGTHEDYHRPTDTSEKIEYEKMTDITRMVFISTWELANL